MRALPLLVLALTLVPVASACSVGPPPDWRVVVPTGEGAVWGNRGWDLGELWLANGSFRTLVALPPFGAWAIAPDARWAALERPSGFDSMCRTSGHRLETVDLRENVAATLLDEDVRAFAASRAHLAVARADLGVLELYDWETREVVQRLEAEPMRFGVSGYGPGWVAANTSLMAFSPSGRLLAAWAGPQHGLLVFDVEAGAPLRPEALPYGPPSPDDLVALAFSPDDRYLAAMTTQHNRFSEVFAWDLEAEDNVVAGLRRHPEAGRGLAWTDAGLVAAFQDEGGPPGSDRVGVLRRWDGATLAGEVELRRADAIVSGGLAGHGGLLYAGVDDAVEVLDPRTLLPFGEPAGNGGTTTTTTTTTTSAPPRNESPLPLAFTLLGTLAAARLSRAGRR